MSSKKKDDQGEARTGINVDRVPKEVVDAIRKRDRAKKKMSGRTIVDVVADEIRNQPKGRR